MDLTRRSYAWQTPLVAGELRSVDLGPLVSGVRAVATDPTTPGLHVAGPEDELLSIGSRTRITENRLAVPIGALLVLFFGVAVLAGLGGRADHQRTASVLRRRGANRWVIGCFRAIEAALPVVGGVIVGVASAVPLGAWLGHRAGLGGWSVVGRSVDDQLVSRLRAVALVAFTLIFAVLGVRDVQPAVRRRSGQRCRGHRRTHRSAGDGRPWISLGRLAQSRRRPCAGGRPRPRRRRARISRRSRCARGAAGDLDGQPPSVAVDEADVGGGHRATHSVDRDRFADRRDGDVLGAHLRVRRDPTVRVPRPSGICGPVRLSCATRRIAGSPAGGGAN